MGLKPRIPDEPHKLDVKTEGGKLVAKCPHRRCPATRSHADRSKVLALMAAHLISAHADFSGATN